MRRRQFIGMVLSTAASWPLPLGAQQGGAAVKRIGVLVGMADGDPDARKYLEVFRGALQAFGWRDGQNIQVDFRSATDVEIMRSRAADLASLRPELILTYTTPATNAVRQLASN